MEEEMFRTVGFQKWWTDSDVVIEWWYRDGNSIKIIRPGGLQVIPPGGFLFAKKRKEISWTLY